MTLTNTTTRATTDECKHCNTSIETFYAPGYCSEYCFYASKGGNVLETNVTNDHKFCSTCFRKIKSVSRPGNVRVHTPPADHPGATAQDKNLFIGWQYPTPNMEIAEASIGGSDGDRLVRPERLGYTRWSCCCGNVDPGERDGILEDIELDTIVANLYRSLQDCYDRGAIDHAPDWAELQAALREEWRDWAYAAGRALHVGPDD